jgi:hypothetical protein
VIDDNMTAYKNQSAFLANKSNKTLFISLVIRQLQAAGYLVKQAPNDADTLIVLTVLEIAKSKRSVCAMANDTDVLILLLYHFHMSMADVFMTYEVNSRLSSRTVYIPVRTLHRLLGETAALQVLAVHAISGCDTTSALFGHGKASVWRRVTGTRYTFRETEILGSESATHEEVVDAGMKLLALIYGGKESERLNHLRYTMYMNMAATSSVKPCPERLPPTENAARYHLYRVHLQVVQWRTLMATDMNAENWGWKVSEGQFVPIATDLEVAPSDILNVVRCKCRSDTQRSCTSQLCSCRKHGLLCVAACKNCNGEACENIEAAGVHMGDDDGDDNDFVLEADEGMPEEEIPEDCMHFDIPWIEEEIVH